MAEAVSILLGFFLTTAAGGWWAARLQQRSWERQNDLRLKEEEYRRAAEVCRDISGLLDKRLYRMRRVFWAVGTHQGDSASEEILDARLRDYNDSLYQWNDSLNTNLALLGSHFGLSAREHLYLIYEKFRQFGTELENAAREVRRGMSASLSLERIDAEFEGWQAGSLNNEVYLLGLTMMTQLREGLVGRSAPDKAAVPSLHLGGV